MKALKAMQFSKKIFSAAAFLAICSASHASEYFVVVPVKGKTEPTVSSISVSLQAATLPEGVVGVPYSYSLLSSLYIHGDPSLNTALASFSTSSSLPSGLALSESGAIQGTPTVKSLTGSPVQVTVTYKNNQSQQTYTIFVKGAPFDSRWQSSAVATVNADGTATVNAALSSVLTVSALPSSGKWYWEITADGAPTYAGYPVVGVGSSTSGYPGRAGSQPGCGLYLYGTSNYIYRNGVESRVANTSNVLTTGVAYDSATRTATFYRAGVSLGVCTVGGAATTYVAAGAGAATPTYPKFTLNTSPVNVPAGYSALATATQ